MVRFVPLPVCVVICVLAVTSVNASGSHHRLVGESATIVTSFGDTIYTLAQQQLLGAEALASANPDVDPLLPGAGIELQLPTLNILPDVKHEGIVVNLPEMRLYFFPPDGAAVQVYPVGIGRQGWDTPVLEEKISSIVKDPVWTPPDSIHQEYQKAGLSLPEVVPAGTDNPLGEYALRIGQTSYLIHGTNKPQGVGFRVSHGCIRLYPQHIASLAASVTVGTPVRIVNQPLKMIRHEGRLFLQGHKPLPGQVRKYSGVFTDFMRTAEESLSRSELIRLKRFIGKTLKNGDLYTGIPMSVPN